jgi:hypothetical protein
MASARPAGSIVIVAIAMVVALCADSASAGTRRHDVDDSLHLALAAEEQFDSVGKVRRGAVMGSGVLVAPNYMLTAAHVAQGGTTTFELASGIYSQGWSIIHSGWDSDNITNGYDLALVRLDTLVLDEQPTAMYSGAFDVGQQATLVGFGRTGTGLTGATEPAGTKRAGVNMLQAGSSYGYNSRLLTADFDDPTKGPDKGLDMEYLAAPGDSGGGVFIDDGGGNQVLAGLVSFVFAYDGDYDSSYGDGMGITRIYSLRPWISSLIGNSYTLEWAGVSGGFNTAANWTGSYDGSAVNVVPGSADVVHFASAGAQSVSWPAGDLANRRAVISAGDVTLNLAGQGYSLTDSGQNSLVVGDGVGVNVSLNVTNGQLLTHQAVIGSGLMGSATVTLASGGNWQASGDVFIGGNESGGVAQGQLNIQTGSSFDADSDVVVWASGQVNLAGGSIAPALAPLGHAAMVFSAGSRIELLKDSFLDIQLSGGQASSLSVDGTLLITQEPDGTGTGTSLRFSGDVSNNGYRYLLASYTDLAVAHGSEITDYGEFAAVLYNGLLVADPAAPGSIGGTHYLSYDDGELWLESNIWAGDINLDGQVDYVDLGLLAGNWNLTSGGTWGIGDLNGDGQVNYIDLGIMAGNWNAGVVSPTMSFSQALAVSAVPEPATLAILGAGAIGLLRRRRR